MAKHEPKKLKISIDFDGTMWARMTFFRTLMHAFQAAGHEVGCLTGHSMESKEKDIELMVKRGFPVPDFYFGRTEEYMGHNGARYKSMVIEREGIDIHFEDYDFDDPKTEQIFKELGQEGKIFRVKAVPGVVQEDGKLRRHFE